MTDASLPPYNDTRQLLTDWGLRVDAADPPFSDEHPNPALARARWCSLNGVWELDRFANQTDDPADASITRRVLTVMLAEDY